MQQRQLVFRKKLPKEMEQIVQDAMELKLFLIHELGPTYFEFRDEQDNKIKIQIGQSLQCSFCKQTSDHCVHTLYSLLKVFKRDQQDPLLWQTSYTDTELSDLVQNRFENRSQTREKKKFLKRKEANNQQIDENTKTNKIQRQDIKDEICPICHEDLLESEALTYCSKMCGTNFHNACAKVWCMHKIKEKRDVTCPNCRSCWDPDILSRLAKEVENFQNRSKIHKNINCMECQSRKNIKGNLYKCVDCENIHLCQKCFDNHGHKEHDKFLIKEDINSQWKPAQSRQKQLTFYIGDQQFNQITNQTPKPNIQQTLTEFLLTCFKSLDELPKNQFNQQSKTLSVTGLNQNMKIKSCINCGINKDLMILECGHYMDKQCLLKIINSDDPNIFLKCPLDETILLKGYYRTKYKIKIKDKEISTNEIVQNQLITRNAYSANQIVITNQKKQDGEDPPKKSQKLPSLKKYKLTKPFTPDLNFYDQSQQIQMQIPLKPLKEIIKKSKNLKLEEFKKKSHSQQNVTFDEFLSVGKIKTQLENMSKNDKRPDAIINQINDVNSNIDFSSYRDHLQIEYFQQNEQNTPNDNEKFKQVFQHRKPLKISHDPNLKNMTQLIDINNKINTNDLDSRNTNVTKKIQLIKSNPQKFNSSNILKPITDIITINNLTNKNKINQQQIVHNEPNNLFQPQKQNLYKKTKIPKIKKENTEIPDFELVGIQQN